MQQLSLLLREQYPCRVNTRLFIRFRLSESQQFGEAFNDVEPIDQRHKHRLTNNVIQDAIERWFEFSVTLDIEAFDSSDRFRPRVSQSEPASLW